MSRSLLTPDEVYRAVLGQLDEEANRHSDASQQLAVGWNFVHRDFGEAAIVAHIIYRTLKERPYLRLYDLHQARRSIVNGTIFSSGRYR